MRERREGLRNAWTEDLEWTAVQAGGKWDSDDDLF